MSETTPGTHRADEGVTDEQMIRQVAEQSDSEREWQPFFEREADGTVTDEAAADAQADQVQG